MSPKALKGAKSRAEELDTPFSVLLRLAGGAPRSCGTVEPMSSANLRRRLCSLHWLVHSSRARPKIRDSVGLRLSNLNAGPAVTVSADTQHNFHQNINSQDSRNVLLDFSKMSKPTILELPTMTMQTLLISSVSLAILIIAGKHHHFKPSNTIRSLIPLLHSDSPHSSLQSKVQRECGAASWRRRCWQDCSLDYSMKTTSS